ncbi:catalase [Beijerinckia sp. L45]|uniref:catalase n=1 Tax=Beijerinckia sp. L45 TaxID=1641855 RepID=UPI001AEEB2FD|nr:catalase [Beijerinckia sp. L45]
MTKNGKPAPMDPMKLATTSPQQRFEGAQTGLAGRDARQETAKTQDLIRDSRDPAPGMTNNQGLGISDDQNSLRAGVRGPTLLEDFQYREKMTHFDHERITERVVHARGFAAHGVFESAGDHSDLTMANLFSEKGKQTPVFVRFSTVMGSRGSADTPRDVRGFSVKFYTDHGVWDLVGNNMPVFFIHDAIKFPDLVHAVKPEQNNEIPQAQSAHDTFWDFASLTPEISHMLMWTMSDRAFPRSFSTMEGFGVHTFRMVDAAGASRFVKFHFKPEKGVHSLVWEEAQKMMGKDPDYNRRDLFEAIERGDFPKWTMGVQVIEEKDEFSFGFDILDPTKLIPEELVPITPLGTLTLNRNVDNYFAETEQVAFCLSHIVPGIDFTNDPLLQGRLFSYLDTQLRRVGPNFAELPINRPLNPVSNNQREGFGRITIDRGKASYFPNNLPGPDGARGLPMQQPDSPAAYRTVFERVDGHKIRARSSSFDDHFTQATMFWNSMAGWEKDHIVAAFSFELNQCETPEIRIAALGGLIAKIDPDLAARVAEKLGIDLPAAIEAAPPPAFVAFAKPDTMPSGKRSTAASPALSMDKPADSILGRKVAILIDAGVDGTKVKALKAALNAEGAVVHLIAAHGGMVKAADGTMLPVDKPAPNASSVFYDGVVVAGGVDPAKMATMGLVKAFLAEAFKFGKAIAAFQEASPVIQAANLPDVGKNGAPKLGVFIGDDVTAAFIAAMKTPRFRNRNVDAVAA